MSKPYNPFDEDTDDAAFRNPAYKPKTGGGYSNLKAAEPTAEQEELSFYERQIESIMQDSLASTGRSLRALEESEQVGVSTAENLLVQGEKLRKAEKELEHIQNTTTQSQRHLNNIKSIFGGVKNYFSKAPPASKTTPSPSDDDFKSTTKLSGTVTTIQTESTYTSKVGPGSYSAGGSGSLPASSKEVLTGTRWGVMDDEIDENLDLMAANLSRLKNLGIGLADEIEDQNKVIDRLQVSVEKTDVVIRDQDKQMKKIMGVKKAKAPTEGKPEGK